MPLDQHTLEQLRHLLRPLATRVANSGARAVLLAVDDGSKMQLVQLEVLEGEVIGDAEHVQPYGFSSVPLAGADTAAVIFPNGDRGHPLVVTIADRRYRPTGGEPGEVTVYNHTGAKIVITKDGDIVATPAPGRKILAGSASAATPPALSSELADLKSRIAAWVPVANDGGASLKPVIAAWPVPGATKVDVE